QDVAKRLSAASLDQVYGYKIPFLGPYPVRIFSSSAQDLEIDYGDTQNLVVKNTQNFQICCSPLKCPESETFSGPNWKNTTISSWSQHSIKLDIGMCAQGANAVRYAWTVTPCPFKDCQVYNDHGLPAAPFIHQFI
uniref:Uncharacterized protein n=1 Tax=Ciona savignyi TaxID=51511 RepID=H2ZGF5_CIOSA